MAEPQRVIYCDCAYSDRIAFEAKQAVLEGLTRAGVVFEAVPDLCKLAADQALCLKYWTECHALTVIGCFPRTIRWLFHAGGVSLVNDFELTCLNMLTQSPEAILEAVLERTSPAHVAQVKPVIEKDGDWVPWFPVIDYDRCQTCKLCMNFCLFGVYDQSDDGQVKVRQPANCKTNCPACARVCPHQAIIFPKYSQAPINGAEPNPDQSAQPASSACLNDLLAGQMHEVLKQRSTRARKRFSTEPRTESPSLLNRLHQELDIPLEVLQALSPADLSRIRKKSSDAHKETTHD
ncbi:MAG: hypothetical protein HQ515_11750 [Phycisphaeraceae bacterium]|nr:hypothetical protein [Phycisphaeraceae bacterium]